jgi:hypothetical protein
VLRNKKGSRSFLDNRLAGVGGGAKKSGFKLGKELERAFGISRGLLLANSQTDSPSPSKSKAPLQ